MKKFSSFFVFFTFYLLLTSFTVPQPKGYVNDFAQLLSPEAINTLETICRKMKEEGLAEYAIVIIKNLDNNDIRDYSQKIFDTWKIGEKGKDNGLLLLFALEDRKIFIQTGYGLEGVLTDGEIGSIIDSEMIPEFKKNNYEWGIIKGSNALYQKLKTAEPQKKAKKKRKPDYDIALIIFILIIVVLNIIVKAIGRSRNNYWGGGGGIGFGGFGGFGGGSFGGGFGGFGGGDSGGGGAGRSW